MSKKWAPKTKAVLLGILIAIIVGGVAYFSIRASQPSGVTIVEARGDVKPNEWVYESFQLSTDDVPTTGQVKVTIPSGDAVVEWLVLKCSETEFKAALNTEDFGEYTVASGSGGNIISYNISLNNPGDYILAMKQTNTLPGVQGYVLRLILLT